MARRPASRATPRAAPQLTETRLGRLAGGVAQAAVLAAVVAVPLYFNPSSERVFEPDKLAWVILLGLLCAVALALAAAERWPAAAPGQGEPAAPISVRGRLARTSPLVLVALATGAVLVLGALGSAFPVISLWGAHRRGLGILSWLGFLALFLAAAQTLRSVAAVERLRRAMLVAALPVAIYALLQRFGVDSIPWQVQGDQPAERAFGPLGNPILLGAYLAMTTPLAVAGLVAAWGDWRSGRAGARGGLAGYLLVTAAGLAAFWASQSRGPVVGLLAGLGLFAVVWAAATGRRRWALGLLAAGLIVALALAFASQAGLPGLGRFGGLLDPASRTAQERLLVWQAIADLAAADPVRALRGYGPDTLMYVLPPHIPDALVHLTGDQTYDRAHNIVWEWWLAGGLLGVLALVALFAAAVATAFRRLGLWATRRELVWLGLCLALGALAGLAGPVGLGAAPYAALGLPVGLVAGAAAYAALAARPQGGGLGAGLERGPALVVTGLVAALAAHLVEGALGLPTAPAELLFWVGLGALAALGRPTWPAPEEPPLAWSDGLVDGLGLAALAHAPLLLPRPPVRSAAADWRLVLLPLGLWLVADLLSDPLPRRAYGRRALARLAVLATFLLLFLMSLAGVGGPLLAFAAVLLATTLVLGWALGRPELAGRPGEAWRWVAYAALVLLAMVAGWRLAVAPVLADTWLRAARQAATDRDFPTATTRFETAQRLWPDQPGFATYIGAFWRDMALGPDTPGTERAAAFEKSAAALKAGLDQVPDDALALRLANVRRDYANALAESPTREAILAEAERYYGVARRIFPRNPSTLVATASFYEEQRRTAEARALYREVLALDRASIDAWTGLARLDVEAGDFDAALQDLQEALALRQGNSADVERSLKADAREADPVVARSEVVLLVATGQLDAARESLGTLGAKVPDAGPNAALGEWLARRPP